MKGSTVFKGILIVVIIVFFSHQMIAYFYSPIKTESAVYSEMTDGLKITGLIVRNETLVTADTGGVMHYVIDDSSRVAKNGVIAMVYDSQSASITVSQIDSVKKKIGDINDLMSYNDLEAADLDLINSRVKTKLDSFVQNTGNGNYFSAEDSSDELLSAVNRRQMALGEKNDFSSQLAELNSQLTSLSSSLPVAKGQIVSNLSGYFVSSVDGYENQLKTDNLDAITPEYLSGINSENYSENVIGKIVSDYEWYICAEVSINDSLNYKEGDSLKLYTSIKSFPILPVTVKKINISDKESKAVIIFACNDMNSELASMRSAPMTVVSKVYTGLKVPKNALRVLNSQKGVYVLNGMQAKFLPVNILYSNDSFMICEKQVSNESVLRIYDQVIVKGNKLYDGKIIS